MLSHDIANDIGIIRWQDVRLKKKKNQQANSNRRHINASKKWAALIKASLFVCYAHILLTVHSRFMQANEWMNEGMSVWQKEESSWAVYGLVHGTTKKLESLLTMSSDGRWRT